jgi:hypothetical protein
MCMFCYFLLIDYFSNFIKRDLTRLLTQEEINYLIYVFEQMDRNKG